MSINDATPTEWDNLRTNHPELDEGVHALLTAVHRYGTEPGPLGNAVLGRATDGLEDGLTIRPDGVIQVTSPVTASDLPSDATERKAIPIYTGFINYFPKAIAAVAKISLAGGIQHGQTAETLHWDRSKSGDELDAMMRHILDGDWEQVAWRAMANLEKKLEESDETT
tara:strand:+ start:22 stop:525 length:504 start_codon:yes stop_codon:yes gene_type:complete